MQLSGISPQNPAKKGGYLGNRKKKGLHHPSGAGLFRARESLKPPSVL
jgi:hypothetical protein